MRAGSFDSSSPLDGPNVIMLDGVAIPSTFFDLFTANTSSVDNFIEERSIALNVLVFGSLVADGVVNLTGTNISEGSGAGSFQVDFLRLDIEAEAVPEPSTLLLTGLGLAAAALLRRRQARS